MTTPNGAQKTSAGFLPSDLTGIKRDGCTVTALTGHGKQFYGGVTGKFVVSEGVVTFGYEITSHASTVTATQVIIAARTACSSLSYSHTLSLTLLVRFSRFASQIVVGITDATDLHSAKGSKSLGFHLGRSKVVSSLNSQKIKNGGKSLSRETPRRLPFDETGRISILVVVDMHSRRLSIAINQNTPIDTGYVLPRAVRPWIWLGGPGVGSVSLSEFVLVRSLDASKAGESRLPSSADATGLTGAAPVAAPPVKRTPTTGQVLQPPRLQVKPLSGFVSVPEDQVLDTPTVDDPDRMSDLTSTMTSSRDEDTSRGGEDTSRGEEPAEWTARATAWLKPLQLMFASNQSEDAADSTASTAEVKQIV